jgi:hypothetical protein
VEAGADFEQAADPPVQFDLAGGRFGDPRENFEERRFAGAVAADNAHDLPVIDLEVQVLERPEGSGSLARWRLAQPPHRPAGGARQAVAQRQVSLAVAEAVALAQPFDTNCRLTHTRSAKYVSIARK